MNASEQPPRYWVLRFQRSLNPSPAEWIAKGRETSWTARRPPKSFGVGDRVFLYMSTPDQRFVALAEVTSPPRPAKSRFAMPSEYRFRFECLTDMLTAQVTRSELQQDRVLRNSNICKSGPSASVMGLSRPEGERLVALIRSRNTDTAKVWREIPNTGRTIKAQQPTVTEISSREGRRSLQTHYRIERDRRLVDIKRKTVLWRTGRLACEVCGFDFSDTYGALGSGVCEVHHLRPLGKSTGKTQTRLSDLAILCANCHRVAHRDGTSRPLRTIREQLRKR